MMPDDAAILARFDDFLDGAVDSGRGDSHGLEAELVETVVFLRSATQTVAPNPGFAVGLRQSLLQRAKAGPVAARSGVPLQATLSPPPIPFPTRRWWPRFELAAVVLVMLAVAGILANEGGYRLIGSRTGDRDGRTVPGYATGSPAASPIATNQAVRDAVAILFIADVSGSMSYDPLGGESRIEMLKEALRQAVNALADGDEIGVLAFNDRQNWIAQLTEIAGPETCARIEADIDGIVAEGGTEILPALSLGLDAIGRSSSPTRHVILLSDGKSRTGTVEDYRSLVAAAAATGMTLSTIAIGDDADTSILPILATTGHGRYHFVRASADVPAVTLAEVEAVTAEQLTTPTPTLPLAPSPDPSAISPGDLVRVLDDDVNLRAEPGIVSGIVAVLSGGQTLVVTGEPVEQDGFIWLPVQDDAEGLAGWVVVDWVEKTNLAGSTSTATPTPAVSEVPGSPTAEQTPNAVLFLIDRSGSMSYDPLGGTAKLELEKETVRRAVAALPVGTTIGVMAFNEWQEWVVPWTRIGATTEQADRREIIAAVDAITAEGGSEMPAALTAAVAAMRADVDATTKHIVLLSDGKWRGGSEQFYRQVVGGAVQEGFVLSTIAFGDDADTATMQLLAEIGNGRYHLVVTPEDIPMLNIEGGSVTVEGVAATPAA